MPRPPYLLLIAPFAAFTAAAAWGAYECLVADVRMLRAWAATTTAAAVPAGFGLALAPVAFHAWRWVRPRLVTVWRQGLSEPGLALAVAATAAVSLVAAWLAARFEHLEPAAVTTGTAVAVAGAMAFAGSVAALLYRRWAAQARARIGTTARAVALVAVAVWLAVLWQPASLTLYFLHAAWVPESLFVIVLVWALMLAADRMQKAGLVLLPAGAAAMLLVIHHQRVEMPNRMLTRLVRQRELTSHWLPWLSHSEPLQAPTASGSTCVPGIAPAADLGMAPEGAPDILFITLDGVAYRHTSFGDPKGNHTPRLLEHAKNAAVFTRAYTPATWTRLTFRSLFTGLDPGLVPTPPSTKWGMSFVPQQETLAGYLRDGGYQTIALHSEPRIFPPQHNALLGFATVDTQSKAFVQTYHYETNFKVNQMVAHLLELPTTAKPRFLWTHILDTHFPYSVGPGRSIRGVTEPARHRMSIEFVDRELSRLLDFALAADRRDRTWVIITADHGEAFTEHGHHRHGYTVYEEELHVPLLVFGPNVRPRHIDTPVSTLALTRTILDAAGLRPARHMCAESLLPALTSDARLPSRPVFAATLPDKTTPDTFKLAWIDGNDKLIWSPAQGSMELYDLQTDALEKNNLADAHPTRVTELAAALRAYLAAQGRNLDKLDVPNGEVRGAADAGMPAAGDAGAADDAGADGA